MYVIEDGKKIAKTGNVEFFDEGKKKTILNSVLAFLAVVGLVFVLPIFIVWIIMLFLDHKDSKRK